MQTFPHKSIHQLKPTNVKCMVVLRMFLHEICCSIIVKVSTKFQKRKRADSFTGIVVAHHRHKRLA